MVPYGQPEQIDQGLRGPYPVVHENSKSSSPRRGSPMKPSTSPVSFPATLSAAPTVLDPPQWLINLHVRKLTMSDFRLHANEYGQNEGSLMENGHP
ncbi:hypothetical protein [Streptomyces sp. NPDC047985]|uniref:hypothetical protein n=1 Tax=unclassified Streptomyces TaxID=2593676 RepID=UPI00342C01D1